MANFTDRITDLGECDMRESIEEYVLAGQCKLNRDAALKNWTLLCRIFKYTDKFFLMEYTPKAKEKLKVAISKEDAEYLINELGLTYIPNKISHLCGTYLSV